MVLRAARRWRSRPATVSIAVVLVALFLLGTAEVFADNTVEHAAADAGAPRRPRASPTPGCRPASSRVNQLAGPPIGAALFAAGDGAGRSSTQAVLVGARARCWSPGSCCPPHGRGPRQRRATSAHDIAEGFRWVRHHAAVRTLVLTIFIFNITFGAAWSVLVLYATAAARASARSASACSPRSRRSAACSAPLSYGWITRRVSLGNIMRVGLIIETLTHLALALTTAPWVALAIFFVFGAHAFIWGTTSITVRQRAVPDRSCRAGSAASTLVGVFGGLVVGSAIGGVARPALGRDRAVLVRVRRLGGVRRADLAPARPHRPRRRGAGRRERVTHAATRRRPTREPRSFPDRRWRPVG